MARNGDRSCSTPVEVSAWTIASTLKDPSVAAFATSSGSIALPHGASTSVTSAPQRRATSAMRPPKTPLRQISARSPGSRRFTKQVSIPAEPVADIGSVSAFLVPNTCRSMACASSSTSRNTGSRCPIVGRESASSTRGGTSDGPGPINTRSVELTGPPYKKNPLEKGDSPLFQRVNGGGVLVPPSAAVGRPPPRPRAPGCCASRSWESESAPCPCWPAGAERARARGSSTCRWLRRRRGR